MTKTELFENIYLISTCSWIMIWLITHFVVIRFIVPRYEEETGFIDTVCFKEVTPFAKYIPSFWSSILYICHLATFMWVWRWVQHSKVYRDIESSEEVTGKFSTKEIRLVKLDLASLIIGSIHLFTVSYVFD
jgi:hypothetical protein